MAPRLQLQSDLEAILGTRNVYFQPPPNFKMQYPCIVYSRDYGLAEYADNTPYSYMQRYQVTYIDRNPDSSVLNKLVFFPMSKYKTFFTKDDLNHDIFTIYY